MIDKVKLILALAILVVGVILFYKLPAIMQVAEVSILIRVGVVLTALVLAFLVAISSDYGKRLAAFLKGARVELRKMVWPTKAETSQTTIIVMIMVIVIGLFLWLIDTSVIKLVYDLFLNLET